MKYCIALICLFTIPLYSQTFFNLLYSSGSTAGVDVDSIKKITFNSNETKMNIVLANGTTASDSCTLIERIVFAEQNTGPILPVELTSFFMHEAAGKTFLVWNTAMEIENYGFEIEKKSLSWEKIGFVEGHGTTQISHRYEFILNPEMRNYEYRLKMIDRNGSYQYSNSISSKTEYQNSQKMILENFPNPFNSTTELRVRVQKDGLTDITVYDAIGRRVADILHHYLIAGESYTIRYSADQLPSGMYFIRMSNNQQEVINKIILIK